MRREPFFFGSLRITAISLKGSSFSKIFISGIYFYGGAFTWCLETTMRVVAIDHLSCFFRPYSALTHARDIIVSSDIPALERGYSHSSHCLRSGWSFIYSAGGRVAGGLAVLRFYYTRRILDKSDGDARRDRWIESRHSFVRTTFWMHC